MELVFLIDTVVDTMVDSWVRTYWDTVVDMIHGTSAYCGYDGGLGSLVYARRCGGVLTMVSTMCK